MTPVTSEEIRAAAQSDDGKREICARVGAQCVETNPGLKFAWNGSGVYLLEGERVIMVYSWTITGHFVSCEPALNVTEYVKRETLIYPELV